MKLLLVCVVSTLLLMNVNGRRQKDTLDGATDIELKDQRTKLRVASDENSGSGNYDESYEDWLGNNESDLYDVVEEDNFEAEKKKDIASEKKEKIVEEEAGIEYEDIDDGGESGSGEDIYMPSQLDSESTTPSDIFFDSPTSTTVQPVVRGLHEEDVDGNTYSYRQMIFVVVLASTVVLIFGLIVAVMVLIVIRIIKRHQNPPPDHIRRREWERGYRRIIDSGVCDV